MTNAETTPATVLFDTLRLNVGILSSNTDMQSKVGAANQIFDTVLTSFDQIKKSGPGSSEMMNALNSLRAVREFTIEARRIIPTKTDQPFTRRKAESLKYKVGQLAKELRGPQPPKKQSEPSAWNC